MKEISELNIPEDVLFSNDHEWAKKEGDTVKIGLDDYAQDQLGDIVFVELPEVGTSFNEGDEFGTVESVKAVSEMFMPIGGEVVAVNENLEDEPELVNSAPYDEGWIIEIKPSDVSELDSLHDRESYLKILKG